MIKYIDLSNKISKRYEGKDYINRFMHLLNLLAPDKYRLDNINMLASIINNKNYNYEQTNKTFPISVDRFGTILHLDIEHRAFSAKSWIFLGSSVNKCACRSISVSIF